LAKWGANRFLQEALQEALQKALQEFLQKALDLANPLTVVANSMVILQQLRVQLAKLLPILLKSMDLGMSLTALSSNEGGDSSK